MSFPPVPFYNRNVVLNPNFGSFALDRSGRPLSGFGLKIPDEMDEVRGILKVWLMNENS
jgi:hypothetical protein